MGVSNVSPPSWRSKVKKQLINLVVQVIHMFL